MIEEISAGYGWPGRSPSTFDGAAVRAYFAIRGATVVDSVRLVTAFVISFLWRAVAPKSYAGVGAALPGRVPVTVRFAGGVASVRPRTNDLDILVHHEPVTRHWMAAEPGDTVVDVGAHIGLYSLLAAASGATVFAIEPDPANRALLESNLRMNGFMAARVFAVAASDHAGSATLCLATGPNRGTSSIAVAGTRPTDSRDPEEVVPVDTLDRILGPFHLQNVDWLKIDVEGHETAVLAGAREVLRLTRHLILEVTPTTAEVCHAITAAAGFRKVAEEPGSPTSNWLLVREGA